MSIAHDFELTRSENASIFNERALQEFDVVVFASTTGEVLNGAQQRAVQTCTEGGGGFVGVHAASDTLYEWPWYGELVGAYFDGHPPGTSAATLPNGDNQHASTNHLPAAFQLEDEWYSFDRNPRGDVHVLLTLGRGSNDVLADYGQGAPAGGARGTPRSATAARCGGASAF